MDPISLAAIILAALAALAALYAASVARRAVGAPPSEIDLAPIVGAIRDHRGDDQTHRLSYVEARLDALQRRVDGIERDRNRESSAEIKAALGGIDTAVAGIRSDAP